MEIRQYAGLLWRRKWVLLLVTIFTAIFGLVASRLTPPVFEASTTLLIDEAPDSQTSNYTAILASERLARTYTEMLVIRPVLQEAISELDLSIELGDLEKAVEVRLVRDTQLIELRVESTDRFVASALANKIVQIFIKQSDAIQAARFIEPEISLSKQLAKLSEQIEIAESAIAALNEQIETSESAIAALNEEIETFESAIAALSEEIETSESAIAALGEQTETSESAIAALSEEIETSELAIAALGTPRAESELDRLQAELAQYQASYTSLLQSYEELRIEQARTISNVIQIVPAEPPANPVRPQTIMNTILAGIVGLLIFLGVVFLNDYLDDTIRTPEDVERVFEAPILGFIAETEDLGKANEGQRLLAGKSHPAVTEAFYSLRTNLEFLGNPGGPRAILVSSIGPGEGKTTVAGHLAASIAKSGKRVVLVDADLKHPGVHRFFGLSNKIGLSDMLKDDLVPQVATQELGSHRFKAITSGSKVDSPAELFGSMWFLKVLTNLRELSDVIVFDGPPFISTESIVLASKLEGVLIVVQPGRTRSAVAKAILEQLTRAQANVLGVVLNRVPRSQLYAAKYPYYDYDSELASEDGPEPRLRKMKKPAEREQRKERNGVVLRKSEPGA